MYIKKVPDPFISFQSNARIGLNAVIIMACNNIRMHHPNQLVLEH